MTINLEIKDQFLAEKYVFKTNEIVKCIYVKTLVSVMRFDNKNIKFRVVSLLESTPWLDLLYLKSSLCLIIFSLKIM